MTPQWTTQQANDWYANQPFYVGSNFNPSSAINQLEMWQADSFDLATIDRELGWAASLGMNLMRVYLHDLLWQQDPDGLSERIDQYLSVATKHGIKTMFVFLDDCWNQSCALGPQPAPQPYVHNSGWVQSPGKHIVADPSLWENVKQFVQGVLERFKRDERILLWDLYNEPGNDMVVPINDQTRANSLALLKQVFEWAREVDGITQPLSVGLWQFEAAFHPMNQYLLETSDVVTFHSYQAPQDTIERIKLLQAAGRPLICTEYMARGAGSTFEHCLPLFKKYNVGAVNWGLVAGKSNTIYPWEWNADKGKPDIYFHDIFWPDGSFIYPREEGAIKSVTLGE